MNKPQFVLPEDDRILTREEGFALMDSFVGTWQGMFDSCGGVEAFLREMRDEGEEDDR